jgi:hypothetical protein
METEDREGGEDAMDSNEALGEREDGVGLGNGDFPVIHLPEVGESDFPALELLETEVGWEEAVEIEQLESEESESESEGSISEVDLTVDEEDGQIAVLNTLETESGEMEFREDEDLVSSDPRQTEPTATDETEMETDSLSTLMTEEEPPQASSPAQEPLNGAEGLGTVAPEEMERINAIPDQDFPPLPPNSRPSQEGEEQEALGEEGPGGEGMGMKQNKAPPQAWDIIKSVFRAQAASRTPPRISPPLCPQGVDGTPQPSSHAQLKAQEAELGECRQDQTVAIEALDLNTQASPPTPNTAASPPLCSQGVEGTPQTSSQAGADEHEAKSVKNEEQPPAPAASVILDSQTPDPTPPTQSGTQEEDSNPPPQKEAQ